MPQLFDLNRKQRPIDVATSQDMRFVLSSANAVTCKIFMEIYSFSVQLNLLICSHHVLSVYLIYTTVVVNTTQKKFD